MQKMKAPILMALWLCLWISACQPHHTNGNSVNHPDTTVYAYTIFHPNRWEIDTNHTNTAIALKVLKACEKNDTSEMRNFFADTVIAGFEGTSFEGPRSKFLAMVYNERSGLKKVNNKLYNCQSVVSKDQTEGWITTWLLQTTTDLKDKTDSVEYVYDTQFKNGKIIMWNKYMRHLKKM